jgi:predicted DNA-binding transcriptional regulator AlpA
MPDIQDTQNEEASRKPAILAGLLTPEQLAQEMGVTVRTVQRWHFQRQGPPRVVIGRQIYYRIESVKAWLAAREEPEARATGRGRQGKKFSARTSSVFADRDHVSPLAAARRGND